MESAMASARTGGAHSDLSITWRGVVDPSQCNHLGHMSVMWYASRFEDASWQLLSLLGLTTSYFRRHNTVMATVRQEMTFNRELAAGDLIEIRSRMLEIRENVLRVYHEMLHTETNATVAVSTLTEAHLDSSTRKPRPLPPEIRRRSQREASSPRRALEFSLPGQW
jgi:acyl-CoA thioester hydrolase